MGCELPSGLNNLGIEVVKGEKQKLVRECLVSLLWSKLKCVLHPDCEGVKLRRVELPDVPEEVFIDTFVSCSSLYSRLLRPAQDLLFVSLNILVHLLESLDLEINIGLELERILIEYLFGWLCLLVIANYHHFLEKKRQTTSGL